MTSIDPELLQELDRHLRGPQGDAPPTVPEAHTTPSTRADISDVLEAIQFAGSSMSAMAERVVQLEAHSQAFEAANQELEKQNRQLALQLGEVTQERDDTAASLEAEKGRMERLEGLTAQHVSRANALEHDLAAVRADLAQVVELVRTTLGAPASMGLAFDLADKGDEVLRIEGPAENINGERSPKREPAKASVASATRKPVNGERGKTTC